MSILIRAKCNFNLIKIQLFIILSYEDLTAAHRRSCADDLYRCLEYFDWLVKFPEMEIAKVVCT